MKRICEKPAIDLPSVEEVTGRKEGICPVCQMHEIVTEAHRSSCGLGVMCRDGLYQLHTILTDIADKRGQHHDVALMEELGEILKLCNECELSVKVAELLLASLEAHRTEWEKHISEKQCTELICMYTYYIDPEKCTGCQECAKVCRNKAITGDAGLIHVLDQQNCNLCGECENICPNQSVKRAGQFIPRCPEKPIPAGTFTKGLGLKRRRPRVN